MRKPVGFFIAKITLVVALVLLAANVGWANSNAKVESAAIILREMLASPAHGIPRAMIQDAQGIVIIPQVVKLGFIIGVQRGEGIVMVRNPDGTWGYPRFITLTAGSFGWQLGVEASDFILVFKTRKSVDNLLKGKFTIGADANAAVGPVGRQIGAATDIRLKAELYSYSRSRGLFAGISLAGSSLDLNTAADLAYYGGQPATRVPEAATRLVELVSQVTSATGAPGVPADAAPGPASPEMIEMLRQNAATAIKNMDGLLNADWQKYFAFPPDISAVGKMPNPQAIRAVLARFDNLLTDAKYRNLTSRPEYATAHGALADLYNALITEPAPLELPPPPAAGK